MMESFANVDKPTYLARKGWDFGSLLDVSASYKRFEGQGIRITNSHYFYEASYILGESLSTVYFGAAVKKEEDGVPNINTNDASLIFVSDEEDNYQVRLFANGAYGVSAYRGTSTLLGSSSGGEIPNLQWFYLEMKVVISATVGEVLVRINGEVVLNLTNQNTKNGTDYIRRVAFGAIVEDLTVYFDDVYADDSKFHGDCRVAPFWPDSDGYTDFIALGAGSHYLEVDETPQPDEDTSYNEGLAEGDKDSYGVNISGIDGSIKGVQLCTAERKTGTQTVKTKPLVKTGGGDYLGEEKTLGTEYGINKHIWEVNPNTSNPWTPAELDAAEFGVEVTSLSTTTTT
jgi:hypothetical protein